MAVNPPFKEQLETLAKRIYDYTDEEFEKRNAYDPTLPINCYLKGAYAALESELVRSLVDALSMDHDGQSSGCPGCCALAAYDEAIKSGRGDG